MTTELVKQCTTEVPQTDVTHLIKVSKVVGGSSPELKLQEIVSELRNCGFHLFVKRESVFGRFKYHAGIQGSYHVPRNRVLSTFLNVTFTVGAICSVIALTISSSNWSYLFLLLGLVFPGCLFYVFVEAIVAEKTVDYVGDIPDKVLENYERVRGVFRGLSAFRPLPSFTVHSMSPLPVVERFAQVDPLMVCWLSKEVGVVVGIWDHDKEVEVL